MSMFLKRKSVPSNLIRLLFIPFMGLLFIHAGISCAAPAWPPLQQVAPDVYVMIGLPEEPSRNNGGHVANNGFIVGKDGVIVIDTGIRASYGEHLLEMIRSITSKPIALVINTHPAQAHIFGNDAFRRSGVPILAHSDADKTIARRCGTCLKHLQAALGAELMQGTSVVRATITVDAGRRLTIAGRELDLVYFGQSHSPGAIAVLDRTSGVLFAGGLISIDRIPEIRDARIDNWIAALTKLRALRPKHVVPAHGPVSKSDRIHETAAYLTALSKAVERNFHDGISLPDAIRHTELPAFGKWALYDELHRRNVHYLYLEIERRYLE